MPTARRHLTHDGQSKDDALILDLPSIIVIRVPVVIAIPSVPVPAMIMLELAFVTGPVARIILFPFIARADPSRAFIRRPGVIAIVPNVAIVGWIPVAVYPCVALARAGWANPNHARRRRCTNPNPDGELRK